jgi:hypothetical protein
MYISGKGEELDLWMKLGSEDLFHWRLLQVIVVEDNDSVCEYQEYFSTNDPTVEGFSTISLKRELEA